MDIFTALSRIWGFFVVIVLIMISEKLHVFFVIKKLKRKLETVKANQPGIIPCLQNSLLASKDLYQAVEELNNYLGREVKIKKAEVFSLDQVKGETVLNTKVIQTFFSTAGNIPTPHSKNKHIKRIKSQFPGMSFDSFTYYKEGKSIEVLYKMKDKMHCSGYLLFLEIKISSIFSYIK